MTEKEKYIISALKKALKNFKDKPGVYGPAIRAAKSLKKGLGYGTVTVFDRKSKS